MNESDPARTQQLVGYEGWLRLLARREIDSRFAGKFSASDAVQQTLLEAWQNWDNFRGETELQRRAWIRQILAFQLAKLARLYANTAKRDVRREQSIDVSLAASSRQLEQLLPTAQSSPSAQAMAAEQTLTLANVLEQLPDDYRQVIVLRNLEELSFAEIADRMQRTPAAIRMLWLRALSRLRAGVTEQG